MIERAYIHVAGPERSGKTTLVEAILTSLTVACRSVPASLGLRACLLTVTPEANDGRPPATPNP